MNSKIIYCFIDIAVGVTFDDSIILSDYEDYNYCDTSSSDDETDDLITQQPIDVIHDHLSNWAVSHNISNVAFIMYINRTPLFQNPTERF